MRGSISKQPPSMSAIKRVLLNYCRQPSFENDMCRILSLVIWRSSGVRLGPSGILVSLDCGLHVEFVSDVHTLMCTCAHIYIYFFMFSCTRVSGFRNPYTSRCTAGPRDPKPTAVGLGKSRQVEASPGKPRQIGGSQQSNLGMGHPGSLWDTRGKTLAGNHKTMWEVYKTMKPHWKIIKPCGRGIKPLKPFDFHEKSRGSYFFMKINRF